MKDILFILSLAVLALPVHGMLFPNGTSPPQGRFVCSTRDCPEDGPCAVLDCAPGFSCRTTIGNPICVEGPPRTCASTDCGPGSRCVNAPDGAFCQSTASGTCASTFCEPGTRCVDLPTGGVCKKVSTKPGVCPKPRPRLFRWNRRPRCQRPCETDASCPGNQKCCNTEGCGFTCRSPVTSITCIGVQCPKGQVCSLQSVRCKRPPCPQRPTCVPAEPRVCPRFACIAIFPPPPCKVDECKSDLDCPGLSGKCCFKCGCGFCLKSSQPPDPPSTCGKVTCGAGQVCKPVPVACSTVLPCPPRFVCVPRDKPGVCPAHLPGTAGVCSRLCNSDSDCKGRDKCCRTTCGGHTCVNPDPCAHKVCPPGRECKKTPTGAICVSEEKPGQCPMYRCPDVECEGREECTSDEECAGAMKCCKNCTGCRRCMCDSVRCGPGEECRRIYPSKICQTFPGLCPEAKNLCSFTAIQEPQCPTARPSSISTSRTCTDQCRTHSQCSEGQMCCDTVCGASVCTDTVLPSTCDTESTCKSRDLTCREVYNTTGVFPRCLQHPPKTSFDDLCKVHPPLLIERPGSGGQVKAASCNNERDKITCPAGYTCRTRFGGGVSACCRDAPQPCDPPCGEGEKCETQPIFCFTRPCPPTPRCVRVRVGLYG